MLTTAGSLARRVARRSADTGRLLRGAYRAWPNPVGLSFDHLGITLTDFSPEGRSIVQTPDFLPDRYSLAGDPFDASPHLEFATAYLSRSKFDYQETRYFKLAARGKLPFPCHSRQGAHRRCREFIYLINRLRWDGYLPRRYGPISMMECADGKTMVLNGKHRLAALMALKVESFPVAFCFDNEVRAFMRERADRSWPPYFYRKSRRALENMGRPLPDHQTQIGELLTAIERKPLANLGQIYHPIPFREFRRLTTQVTPAAAYQRLAMIVSQHVDFHGKRVLDLGCNVGFYSFSLAKRGAEVTGLDLGAEHIEVAQKVSELYDIPVDFQHRAATPEFFAEQHERYDVVLCFSTLQWVIAQNGAEAGRRLLKSISEHSQALFFDLPVNTGRECLVCPAGEELAFVARMLRESGSFDEVVHLGDVHPYGTDTRHVFLARVDHG